MLSQSSSAIVAAVVIILFVLILFIVIIVIASRNKNKTNGESPIIAPVPGTGSPGTATVGPVIPPINPVPLPVLGPVVPPIIPPPVVQPPVVQPPVIPPPSTSTQTITLNPASGNINFSINPQDNNILLIVPPSILYTNGSIITITNTAPTNSRGTFIVQAGPGSRPSSTASLTLPTSTINVSLTQPISTTFPQAIVPLGSTQNTSLGPLLTTVQVSPAPPLTTSSYGILVEPGGVLRLQITDPNTFKVLLRIDTTLYIFPNNPSGTFAVATITAYYTVTRTAFRYIYNGTFNFIDSATNTRYSASVTINTSNGTSTYIFVDETGRTVQI